MAKEKHHPRNNIEPDQSNDTLEGEETHAVMAAPSLSSLMTGFDRFFT